MMMSILPATPLTVFGYSLDVEPLTSKEDCICALECIQCGKCRSCRIETLKAFNDPCICGATDCFKCDCYILGDVNNDGSINITDAFQILMKLGKINSCLINSDTTGRSLRASLITNPTEPSPQTTDALQVLMRFSKINSGTINGTIDGRNRNNAKLK